MKTLYINEDQGRFPLIGSKMSTEDQLRIDFFSIFFIVALIYQEIEGMNDSKIDVLMLLKN